MKKVLAIMLACFMLVSLLPMGALAEEIEQVKCPYEGKNHYKDILEKEGIGYTWVADVPGTCGNYSYTVYSCDACGDYFAAGFVKIDGEHDFVVTKAATCTEAGEQVCAICEAKEEIPALGHKASGEASCLEASTCTVCGEELDPKTAHTWGDKPSKIVKEPNEETLENGLAEYTCTVCGEVKEVEILAHQCAMFNFKVVIENGALAIGGVDPTCTEPGLKPHGTCIECGRYWIMTWGENGPVPVEIVDKAELEIPAIGYHTEPEIYTVTENLVCNMGSYGTYSDWIVPESTVTVTFTVAEDVTTNSSYYEPYFRVQVGMESYGAWYADYDLAYLYAGETATVTFEAGQHYRLVYGCNGNVTYSYDAGVSIVAGDCTTKSVKKYVCAVCGEKVEEPLDYNHNWAVTYHTEPTCTTYGYTIESCLDCGENSIERHDKLGHTTFEEAKELGILWEGYWNGSCLYENEYYWDCQKCGEPQELILPPSDHVYAEGGNAATCNTYRTYFKFCVKENYGDLHAYVNAATGEVLYYDYARVMGKDAGYEEGDYYYDKLIEVTSIDTITVKEENYNGDLVDVEYPVVWVYVDEGFDTSKHNPGTEHEPQVIEPTCTEEGLIIYWCIDCETGIVETIPALGHKWVELDAVAPTCGEDGYIARECETCGKFEVVETIEFTSEYIYESYDIASKCHNIEGVEPEVYVPGICGERAQLDRYTCATCGQYILVKNDSFEHHVMPEGLLEKDDENNVPVEIIGSVDYENEVINGLPVTVAWGDYDDIYFTFTAPIDGKITGEVISGKPKAVCGSYYFHYDEVMTVKAGETYTINIWGENFEINLFYVDATTTLLQYTGKDATCTEDGYTAQYVCERCNKIVESEEIKAAGHKEVIDVEAKEATCTEAGATKGWHCEVCGETEESVVIPAKGHTPVLVDSAEWEENKQYGYEHYQCTTCGYEYIINYEPVCIHEWNTRADRDLSIAATCTAEGKKVYKCLHCDAVKEEIIDRLHHTNAAGQDLEYCGTETEDCICASCKGEFEIPAHDYDDGVFYPANCLSNAYIMYTCQVCDHYEVEDITETKGEHVWGRWAPVYDENGVVVEEARGCAACGLVERQAVEEIAFSATIENAANAEGTITDGSLVKVTIAVSGSEDLVWGFQLNIPYTENMTFVKAEFVSTSFTYATMATNHDGFVTIIANADGDVILNGKENIVELYFTVAAPEKSEIAVDIEIVETLNAEGKPVEAVAFGAKAETVLLMELDGEEGITLADALVAYNLIVANEYDAAADLDKDGIVTLADYLYLFKFLSGAMDYKEIVALG